MKFFKNNLMILKKYFNNCKINKLNYKLIIMIIYNKNIFFINNNY